MCGCINVLYDININMIVSVQDFYQGHLNIYLLFILSVIMVC